MMASFTQGFSCFQAVIRQVGPMSPPSHPVTVYLSPEDIATLDRLADLRTVRTGKNTSRTDLVREAVKLLLASERG